MRKSESGATLVEYALLVALIAIIAIAALRFLGIETDKIETTIGNKKCTCYCPKPSNQKKGDVW